MSFDEMIDWLDEHAVAYGKAGDVRKRQQAWAIREVIEKQKADGRTVSVDKLTDILNRVRPKPDEWQQLDQNKLVADFKAAVANTTLDAAVLAVAALSHRSN